MRNFFPKRSKRGVTLVESVIAVVVLGIFATGILTLLTTGGTKILETSGESAAYAKATQMLDQAIAAISSGSEEYLVWHTNDDGSKGLVEKLDDTKLNEVGIKVTGTERDGDVIRGWYLSLTYQGQTVTGYAANTEGVFELEDDAS